MFISIVSARPAASAVSVTIRTFSSTASAVIDANVDWSMAPDVRVPLMPTMSASRAANFNMRGPPPPISSGGGVCTGLGRPS